MMRPDLKLRLNRVNLACLTGVYLISYYRGRRVKRGRRGGLAETREFLMDKRILAVGAVAVVAVVAIIGKVGGLI